jgi:all-trans-retinol 13,14-reductase
VNTPSDRFVKKRTLAHLEGLTSNKDLQTVFCYCWGNIGTGPAKSGMTMQSLLTSHYMKSGAFYPVGGASEFTINIIPVIERAGGKVLVRATVETILYDGDKVTGVRVRKGATDLVYDIKAKCVVSDAGLLNTFEKLLPRAVAEKSYFKAMTKELKPSCGSLCVFLGLNASNEELGLKAQGRDSPNS